MNLLISSAGRQLQLLDCFLDALTPGDNLFVADADSQAPAMSYCKKAFLAPRYNSSEYIDWLLSVCRTNKVDYLMTLSVDELSHLVPLKQKLFQVGCTLIGASQNALEIGQNKINTSYFCQAHGIDYPKIYLERFTSVPHNLLYPVIVKEICGKGSRGIRIVHSRTELLECYESMESPEKFMVQEYVCGQEFGADIVCDLSGNHVATFCRRKKKMDNGETNIAISEHNDSVADIGAVIGDALKVPGPVDSDYIISNGKAYLLDLNLRFGGGYMFSHNAGANLPAALVAWMKQTAVDPKWLNPKSGIMSHRKEGQVIIYEHTVNL